MSVQRFPTSRPVRLEVQLPFGELEIATTDAEESIVTLEGTSTIVEATKIELVGDRLLVAMRRRPFSPLRRFDGSLNLVARVPNGSQVELVTASGEATLDGSFAELTVKAASGDVAVVGEITGAASVKTVSGNVRLPSVGGDVSVRSVSGDVYADSVGGSVSVKSVSGQVRVGSLREGEVDVQSVSGDVELGIAVGTNVDVDARSHSGALTSEVPLSARPERGGGPTVVVRGNTASGDFRLFRAA
jgi:DUF4097 and DUF4098 domain-containing protein YvlB